MKRATVVYNPRTIDRAIFSILAALMLFVGLYIVGPWYLDETLGSKSPLLALLDSNIALILYGTLTIIDGIALVYSAAGKGLTHSRIMSHALLAGFLIRLYALIGQILTLHSWRPPSYLTQVVIVLLFGVMWVWVKVNAKPIQ
jgi:hypothetical protein